MAVYKCKMCGATLEITDNESVVTCGYCDTQQTVPTVKDENLQGLYNRANTLRLKSEFDKAEQIYEKIIQADETQAEAYWGLILCKYGIEYVEDPKTFKRVPTCHRASFDSVTADEDYKNALKYADGIQYGVYERDAQEINRIQKEILEISSNEEPYDVFICYKETDEYGKRTPDSGIANDIYYQLTQEGFKVFYAAVTLEDKLGSDYEPCIFAALNSAKVMLVIGTKPEYFNAVWVKNEWSRFLKIRSRDRSRLIIPCYRDMEGYELPDELANIQSQDMSSIGFIPNVVRAIKKLIVKVEATPVSQAPANVSVPAANIAPLLKRASMYLEDGDFKSANEYCEKVLDIEPENAKAYIYKLLADLKLRSVEKIASVRGNATLEKVEENNSYKKFIRFASDSEKVEVEKYLYQAKVATAEELKSADYNKVISEMHRAVKPNDFNIVAAKFDTLGDYKEAVKKAAECRTKAEIARKEEIYSSAKEDVKSENVFRMERAYKNLEQIPDYKDSADLRASIPSLIEKIKAEREEKARNKEYERAVQCAEKGVKDHAAYEIENALIAFESLSGYKDVDEKVIYYKEQYDKIIDKEKEKTVRTVLQNDYYAEYPELSNRNEYQKKIEALSKNINQQEAEKGKNKVGCFFPGFTLLGFIEIICGFAMAEDIFWVAIVGILVFFVFGFMTLLSIKNSINLSKEIKQLESQKSVYINKIAELNRIETFESYCARNKNKYSKEDIDKIYAEQKKTNKITVEDAQPQTTVQKTALITRSVRCKVCGALNTVKSNDTNVRCSFCDAKLN